ncbi:adhesion G protein-coupled receptor G3 [Oryzias latipes]|uniref:Adhesion G protein-coupled receptor G3 n=1 Tax=Oryzias latipes TaxID=8090 RepID=A0A3B3I197_ORYLA|nr:adhesion G protein-coupled receptor G3 [Oryzias latipes]
MWVIFVLFTSACFSLSQTANWCESVLGDCLKKYPSDWTSCYENGIMTCKLRGRRPIPGLVQLNVNSSLEAAVNVTSNVQVVIPPSALQKSRGNKTHDEVRMVASVLNSTFFKSWPPTKGGIVSPQQPDIKEDSILDWTVLSVRSGTSPVKNLIEPIKLTFKSNKKVENGICVFWKVPEQPGGTGEWSTDGCQTTRSRDTFICSSSHMSFFAVLVNPDISVDMEQVRNLSYITYVGSALSVVFATISIIIYICVLRRGRSEKAIGIHMQLTGALLCLHLSFLLSSLWFQMLEDQEDGWVCKGLGLILHWSLLATLAWLALEGFHLYLLLIRVFNIYVRRYVLKLSLLGWGFPTVAAVACGISGVYGKFDLEFQDGKDSNSTAPMCWMSSGFKHRQVVGYITVSFLCLVVLYNTCMLALVVFKIHGIRSGRGQGGWKKTKVENGSQVLKDCVTVLGISFVLGLPWGLTSTTYVSLTGIYAFTILNSMQGLFIFLWCVALSCKSQSENSSSFKDPSSQKMMSTSFNN